jgi:outer membrane biosynthesis protein TonB
MHAKGQGTRQSELNAYAWATLAAESGEARGQALADELRPTLAPGSDRIAEDIRAPYTRAALDTKLMPQTAPDEGVDRRCWAVKQVIPEYPADAQRRGMDGELYVEWTVSNGMDAPTLKRHRRAKVEVLAAT